MSARKFLLVLLLHMLFTSILVADSTSVVNVDVAIRSRIETYDNTTSLDEYYEKGTSYARNRTSIFIQVNPLHRLQAGIRFSNEFRHYFVPENKAFEFGEVVIDQLYLRVDSLTDFPFSVILGRQNIVLGEGFVVADGTPLDGSRTAYFNAVNAWWQFGPRTELRLIFVSQEDFDTLLPVLDNRFKRLSEQDEQARIMQFSSHFGSLDFQSYLIRKHNAGGYRQRSPVFHYALNELPEAELSCTGARAIMPIWRFTLTAEGAIQNGEWGEVDHKALGGYGYLTYVTGLPMYFPKQLTLGAMYLSGDDPVTEAHEAWEPLFGRWPKWSESMVYTLGNESGSAYWSNYKSIYIKTSVDLSKEINLSLEQHFLYAPETSDSLTWAFQDYSCYEQWDGYHCYPSGKFPGGIGTTRGGLIVGKLTYQMSPQLSGHILYERFNPGSYYFDEADRSVWMRMEMMLKF